ncbi:MAG: hypothetical protein HW388_183 [Dehalococcoidia bacterium]|nr:hypothetical protein [Dehalococcoidia bacterium]
MDRKLFLMRVVPLMALVLGIAGVVIAINSGGTEGSATGFTQEELAAGERCLDLDTLIEDAPGGTYGDYAGARSMQELVAWSPIIVRGTVVAQTGPVETTFPVRQPPVYVVSTVQVIEVLKGDLQESQITIGHMWDGSHPALPVGCEAMVFMREVDSPYGNDYTAINGPQGEFAIALDQVSPMSPGRFDMTQQYRGMSKELFLHEVREAIALSGGQ